MKARASLNTRRGARGFTAIEVLIAMTIMAIGAGAVMSMQKASIQGNLDARKADVANSIARMWVERLRRDAMQWTLVPGNGSNTTINNTAPKLLNQNVGSWGLPTAYLAGNEPTMSYGFDILGRDLSQAYLAGTISPTFCVNVQLTTMTATLIRADVRVLWPRGIASTPANFCQAVDATLAAGTGAINYHSIYVTTALTVNASQPQ